MIDADFATVQFGPLVDAVIAGLSDTSHDIKLACHLMLQRLAKCAPTELSGKLDIVAEPLKVSIESTTKSSAVKQDLEKHAELVSSSLKTLLALNNLDSVALNNLVKLYTAPGSAFAQYLPAEYS